MNSVPKGIPIDEFREQLRLRATPITSLNALRTGEENVPVEYAQMQREIREKKLLDYQLRVKKGDINSFLKSKYSSGEFNEAIFEGYDNSKQRLENGITYEYHVFFPREETASGVDVYAGKRPAAQFLLTKPLISATGDSYIYHIPLHINENGVISTDGEEEDIDSAGNSVSKDGIVHALESYRKNLVEGRNSFDKQTMQILKRNGFVQEGKFTGAIPNRLVEKYLKSINERNRHNAMEYLNAEFEKEKPKDDAVEDEPKDEPKDLAEPVKEELVEEEKPPSQTPVKKQGVINPGEFKAVLKSTVQTLITKLDLLKIKPEEEYERVIIGDFTQDIDALKAEIMTLANSITPSSFTVEGFNSKFEKQLDVITTRADDIEKQLETLSKSIKEIGVDFQLKNGAPELFSEDEYGVIVSNLWFADLLGKYRAQLNATINNTISKFSYDPNKDSGKQLREALKAANESARDALTFNGKSLYKLLQTQDRWIDVLEKLEDAAEPYVAAGIKHKLKTHLDDARKNVKSFEIVDGSPSMSALTALFKKLDNVNLSDDAAKDAKASAVAAIQEFPSKLALRDKELEKAKAIIERAKAKEDLADARAKAKEAADVKKRATAIIDDGEEDEEYADEYEDEPPPAAKPPVKSVKDTPPKTANKPIVPVEEPVKAVKTTSTKSRTSIPVVPPDRRKL